MDQFDLYFSQLVGWQYHPGNRRDERFLTLDECALMAIEMMKVRAKFEDLISCQLSQQD